MSMRWYGQEGYGFYTRSEDFDKVMDFIKTEAPEHVREVFEKYGPYENIEDIQAICGDCFNTESPSVILAETIANNTHQDVQCVYDEDGGHAVLLLPSYPWHARNEISMEDYEAEAGRLAKKFYNTDSIYFGYENIAYFG